ncbi:unnamed protein product [Ixodes hexagonus]
MPDVRTLNGAPGGSANVGGALGPNVGRSITRFVYASFRLRLLNPEPSASATNSAPRASAKRTRLYMQRRRRRRRWRPLRSLLPAISPSSFPAPPPTARSFPSSPLS